MIREAKLGAGLRHLPSAENTPNAVWMWAALLAGNLSVVAASPHRINPGSTPTRHIPAGKVAATTPPPGGERHPRRASVGVCGGSGV